MCCLSQPRNGSLEGLGTAVRVPSGLGGMVGPGSADGRIGLLASLAGKEPAARDFCWLGGLYHCRRVDTWLSVSEMAPVRRRACSPGTKDEGRPYYNLSRRHAIAAQVIAQPFRQGHEFGRHHHYGRRIL